MRLPADVAYAAQRIMRVRRQPGRYALRFVVDERGIFVEEIECCSDSCKV